MKKLVIVVSILALVALSGQAALAWGPNWGGNHMGSGWMHGYNQGWRNSPEQTVIEEEYEKFYTENATVFKNLRIKQLELQALIANPESSMDEVRAKQKEVLELQNQLAEKRLILMKGLQSKYPDMNFRGNGRGYGRNHWGMRGFGGRGGQRGFGGFCWQ